MNIQNITSMNRGNSSASTLKADQAVSTQPIEQKANMSTGQNRRSAAALDKANKDSQKLMPEKKQALTEDDVLKAIEKANSSIAVDNARFEYSIHEDTKRIMVKVIDIANDEVIKEFPAEEILDLVAKIWEMSGILLDEKR